jgi:hypothetical protein
MNSRACRSRCWLIVAVVVGGGGALIGAHDLGASFDEVVARAHASAAGDVC